VSELTLAGRPERRRPGRSAPWSESMVMITRGWRLSVRQVDSLLTALFLPIMLMLLFVFLFGGAVHTGVSYVDYVVPGVILICVGFGAGTTAVSVAQDLAGPAVDRFRSMDVRGDRLINGHVVASVGRNLVATAVVFGVAFAIGFRAHSSLMGWLVVIGVLSLFMLALSWLAAAIGILAGSAQAASGIAFFISFLAYPSSAMVPVQTMPSWIRGFAGDQPVNQVVITVRSVLSGGSAGASAGYAVAWSAGIIVASMVVAAALFRRRTR